MCVQLYRYVGKHRSPTKRTMIVTILPTASRIFLLLVRVGMFVAFIGAGFLLGVVRMGIMGIMAMIFSTLVVSMVVG